MDLDHTISQLHIKPQRPSPLDSLDHDILVLIIEQLYLDLISAPRLSLSLALDPLKQLRFVSLHLYVASRPFRNRNMENVCVSEYSHPKLWNHITKYTRNFVFSRSIDWKAAAELLASCARVESIEWSWWDRDTDPLPIPKVLGDVIRTKWPKAELHIVGYPWSLDLDLITPSIPRTNIVSITTKTPRFNPYSILFLEPFRRLAAASPNLRSLEFQGMKYPFSVSGPRISPIKHLKMVKCFWNYSDADVNKIWDFSQLESLEVDDDCSARFFSSLSREALPCLKTLKVNQGYHNSLGVGMAREIHHFVSKATGMRSIDVVCDFPVFNIGSLIDGWQELRTLKIHDYIGFGQRGQASNCPTILAKDLTRLQLFCPRLRELSLDMDTKTCDKFELIGIIAQFRSLTKLSLHTQTTLLEFGDNGVGDPDLEAARALIDHLTTHKDGLSMEVITLHICGFGLIDGLRYSSGWSDQERKGHSRKRQFTFSWNEKGRRRIFIQTPLGTGSKPDRGEVSDDLILRASVATLSVCDDGVGHW